MNNVYWLHGSEGRTCKQGSGGSKIKQYFCVHNKMLLSDWFLTAPPFLLNLAVAAPTLPDFDLSNYKLLVTGQVKSDS